MSVVSWFSIYGALGRHPKRFFFALTVRYELRDLEGLKRSSQVVLFNEPGRECPRRPGPILQKRNARLNNVDFVNISKIIKLVVVPPKYWGSSTLR